MQWYTESVADDELNVRMEQLMICIADGTPEADLMSCRGAVFCFITYECVNHIREHFEKECYSAEDLFCCCYAPFFWQAIADQVSRICKL